MKFKNQKGQIQYPKASITPPITNNKTNPIKNSYLGEFLDYIWTVWDF